MAAASSTTSSQSQNSAPIAMSQQPAQPSRLARGSSFRIPMPPSSPNPGAAGAASPPIPMAGSPSSGAGALSSSLSGAPGSSRFGGLVQGFRRARGQSTTRGTGNANDPNPTSPYAAGNPYLPPQPSPPVATAAAFPTLAASTSLNDFGPSSPYFDGDHHGGQLSSHHGSQQHQQQQYTPGGTSTSLTGRGFMRRGFGRKNTAGFLGSGAGGGQRTPTGEVPPPLIRNRSSSQPSLPLAQDHPASPAFQNTPYSANSLPGQAPSFFPAQSNPTVGDAGTPAQERADPLAPSAPNVATTSSSSIVPAAAPASSTVAPITTAAPVASTSATASSGRAASGSQHIRLVPHLDNSSARSLSFEPVSRDVQPTIPLRIGRFTDRNPNVPVSSLDQNRVAFKSKVVSRTHAEIWYDPAPPAGSGSNAGTGTAGWFIRDLKSSSGTFLNHIRLSGPGIESRPFPLRDGDVLQLGVDYQGGTEEIYRCVKMRVELNRGWQRGVNSFNSSALAQIRAFGNVADEQAPNAQVSKDKTKTKKKRKEDKAEKAVAEKPTASAAPPGGVTDCCICLFSVTVYQALFIAPCSHIFHFKCIRPLLVQHHPGFSCPLCRTFADLEADVEQDDVAEPVVQDSSSSGEEEEEEDDGMEGGGPSARASLEARDPQLSAIVNQPSLDAGNLDTLRPGKRSPAIGARGSIGDRPGLSPRASQDSSRSQQGPSTPAAGRMSSSSFRRDGLSHPRGGSPAASLGAVSPGGAGGSAGDFHPPSAGDFEADIRRSSIYVQGAGGMASVIPITGRSRPGSVYEADMSDSNIAIGAAAAASGGTPTPAGSSSVDRNRARSVRSLRMSTNSIGSLRQAAQGQGQSASSGSGDVPYLEASHPARVGSMISQYHDFPDSDNEQEDGEGGIVLDANQPSPPNTARPRVEELPRLFPVHQDSASQAGTSPASVFTAPMSAGTSLTTEGLPITGSSSGESSLPGAQAANEDEQAITPPSSNLDHEGRNMEKGKAKDNLSGASGERPATLPGGLEDMEAPVDGEGAADFVARASDDKDNARVTRASARANELA